MMYLEHSAVNWSIKMKKNEVNFTRAVFNSIKKYELSNDEAMGSLVAIVKTLVTMTKVLELEVKSIDDIDELIAQLDIN